jgi:hypothetical protein
VLHDIKESEITASLSDLPRNFVPVCGAGSEAADVDDRNLQGEAPYRNMLSPLPDQEHLPLARASNPRVKLRTFSSRAHVSPFKPVHRVRRRSGLVMKVRQLVSMIEKEGWQRVRSKGGHRQYKHPWSGAKRHYHTSCNPEKKLA